MAGTTLSSILPEVINHYNIYKSSNKLVGVSGEVDLGELEALTETIEGAGVIGEFEDPVTGQFSNVAIKIPFAVLYTDYFELMDTTDPPELTLRGSMQCMDSSTGKTDYYPVKVVVRGKAAKNTLGKVAKGKKGEPEIEMNLLYIKILINGNTVLELDKLNFKFVLNGKDMLEKIRAQV